MKKLIALIFFISTLFTLNVSAQQYATDIIVTSPNGIWTDSRAYSTLNDAIAAVETDEREIVIATPQTVTDLTIPSNVSLKFYRNGAINNTGQLTINTKNIEAPSRQIFIGTGDIDFADGSIVKASWFSNLYSAFNLTQDDSLTMLIDKQSHLTSSIALGNNVTLKWDSPNIIQVDVGVTFSNLKNIEAGNYQIFAGLGDFDFLDGTVLKSVWFNRLRSAVSWIESELVTIEITYSETLDMDLTIPTNITLSFNNTKLSGAFILAFAGSPDSQIKALPGQQIFGSNLTVTFGVNSSLAHAGWFSPGTTTAHDSVKIVFPDNDAVNFVPTHYAGDCIIIVANGHAFIIDMMEDSYQFAKIQATLTALGNPIIDTILITHYHDDHYGNLSNFLTGYDLSETRFILPRAMANAVLATSINPLRTAAIAALAGYDYEDADNETIQFYGATIKIFNGSAADVAYYDALAVIDYNAYSILAEVEYQGKKVLLTSDATTETQQRVIAAGYLDGKVDIMKATHHMMETTYENFYRILQPDYVVATLSTHYFTSRSRARMVEQENYYLSMGSKIYYTHEQTEPLIFELTDKKISINSDSIIFRYNHDYGNLAEIADVVARQPSQGLQTKVTADGTAIRILDNDNLDFGTYDFTIIPTFQVDSNDLTVAYPIYNKGLATRGVNLRLLINGPLYLTLYRNDDGTNYYLSSEHLLDSKFHTSVVSVVRETASTDGSITCYQDSTKRKSVTAIPAAATESLSNAVNAYFMGYSDHIYRSIASGLAIYNYAISEETANNYFAYGVDEHDKWGSQTALTSGTLIVGKRYKIDTFAAGDDFANVGGTNVTGNEFIATGTTPTTWTNSSSLRQIGALGLWEPAGLQPYPGQWHDSSTNKNHALLASVSELIHYKKEGVIKWTNTWAGTHEAQNIGDTSAVNILPVGAYIDDIIGVITGSTIEDIIIGDGSDTDRWVTLTTGLSAGTTSFAIANHISNGTNYKMVVDPDSNFTGSIEWTIRYHLLN